MFERMVRRIASVIAAVALGAGVAACGGAEEQKGGTGPGARTPGSDIQVQMKDIKYIPQDVSVNVGGTVEWKNDDAVAHTVTKMGGPGPQFDSGTVAGGATFRQVFDAPGKVSYFCEIHPQQKGTVTVR